jgi:hypothetical protein
MDFDDRYLSLVGLYKKLRRSPNREEEANKAFEAVESLKRSGKISQEALEIARYI